MARTVIGLNDPKAVKRYAATLATDVSTKSYWGKKFIGRGADASAPVHELLELSNDAGEMITYDLAYQMRMQPVEGDDVLEGKEVEQKFATDTIYIDQMRGGQNTGGRMTRKRTLHKLRDLARKQQSKWWMDVFDELLFMYVAGARGENTGWNFPTDYAGFANNPVTAPDSEHLIVAGGKAKATLTTDDKMSLGLIDTAVAYAEMMMGGADGTPQIQPVMVDGEEHYVCVMNPYQAYDLKRSTDTGEWMDYQRALTTAEGRKADIFKGALGMYGNVLLHKHNRIPFFSDYGSGGDVAAARALFLGDQAAVVAFGSPGTGMRFDWNEETRDNGNQVVITSSSILGAKKTVFGGKDLGCMAIDTAAARPAA